MNILKDLLTLIVFCAIPLALLLVILHTHTYLSYWAINPVI